MHYRRPSKADKGKILDVLCATMGWLRNHALKALGQALRPKVCDRGGSGTCGAEVLVALSCVGRCRVRRLVSSLCWCWRIWSPGCGDSTSGRSVTPPPRCCSRCHRRPSRRLAPARAAMTPRRSHTKPGSLLKDAVAIQTWAQ